MNPIYVAIDTPDVHRAAAIAREVCGIAGGVKLGLEFFYANGEEGVLRVAEHRMPIFLDLKLHDIPNTVAGAARAAARTGASFLTVHALGGAAMIQSAVAACAEAAPDAPPVVLAVTILTSHDDAGLRDLGLDGAATAVPRLAAIARRAGAGGIVCSPLEIRSARSAHPGGTLVVPGIRPGGNKLGTTDDQARVATPEAAIRAGADRIVVGRPITEAPDPAAAAEAIAASIASAAAG